MECTTQYNIEGDCFEIGNCITWIDKETDPESNLGDFGARKYEGWRFTSPDALWEEYRAWSPYHYSRNNPLVLMDPSGLADYYNENGHVTSDGVDDGKKFALMKEINVDDFKDDHGNIDFSLLERVSIKFPSERVRQGITQKVINKISVKSDRENAGVIALDESGNEQWKHGGSGPSPDYSKEDRSAHSEEQVMKALNEAESEGMTVTWFVRSHPHPKAPYGQQNQPQGLSSSDKRSSAILGIPGILVTKDKVVFFGPNGAISTVKTSDFEVEK